MSANRCRKKDDKCRTADSPSCARSKSHPPQNPHSQCQSCHADETAAPAIPPGKRTTAPCRTASSADAGCPPIRRWAGKSSAARPATTRAPCARRISSSAHRDRNPNDPTQSLDLPKQLRGCVSPPPPPYSRSKTVAARDNTSLGEPTALLPEYAANSPSYYSYPTSDFLTHTHSPHMRN